METLIENLHNQWLIAKELRRQRCEASGQTEVAQKLAQCKMFSGNEDIAGLVDLLTSPQGIEFCLNNQFPALPTFRQFKQYDPEKYGVYIDAGGMVVKNPERIVLIGRTSATLNFDTNERHEVILMHGARCVINASRWAVVSYKSTPDCQVICNITQNAIVL